MKVPMPDEAGYFFHVPERSSWIKLCDILFENGIVLKECRDEIRYLEVIFDEQER